MSLPQISEIKDLKNEELHQEILKVKKELFDLRFKKSTRQSFKPHEIKHAKHRLAQLLTIEHQKILNTIFSD
uniref:Large ribosomal subunit protein uL29c n=1 Tax=Triparma laevis TaxID=1534972 RepID=A0A0K2RWZ3_9STRA|nr:chloroplast 50S ribosomal protein L29 [Triparma laevis]BAS19112.1 chloroplast 50S ribosomal protein L29 [Triparma laevis]